MARMVADVLLLGAPASVDGDSLASHAVVAAQFLATYPPSRTVGAKWIQVDAPSSLNGVGSGAQAGIDVLGLTTDWDAMVLRARRNELVIDADVVLSLARKWKVTGGKWLVYESGDTVDLAWRTVAKAVMAGALGNSAKVSTHCPEDTHLIAVFTRDATDVSDVRRVLTGLRALGYTTRCLHYQPDIYGLLNIHKGNPFGMRPSLYTSDAAAPWVSHSPPPLARSPVPAGNVAEAHSGRSSSSVEMLPSPFRNPAQWGAGNAVRGGVPGRIASPAKANTKHVRGGYVPKASEGETHHRSPHVRGSEARSAQQLPSPLGGLPSAPSTRGAAAAGPLRLPSRGLVRAEDKRTSAFLPPAPSPIKLPRAGLQNTRRRRDERKGSTSESVVKRVSPDRAVESDKERKRAHRQVGRLSPPPPSSWAESTMRRKRTQLQAGVVLDFDKRLRVGHVTSQPQYTGVTVGAAPRRVSRVDDPSSPTTATDNGPSAFSFGEGTARGGFTAGTAGSGANAIHTIGSSSFLFHLSVVEPPGAPVMPGDSVEFTTGRNPYSGETECLLVKLVSSRVEPEKWKGSYGRAGTGVRVWPGAGGAGGAYKARFSERDSDPVWRA